MTTAEPRFATGELRHGFEGILGAAERGAANADEARALAAEILERGEDAWPYTWAAAAGEAWAAAVAGERDGRRAEARAAFLRAATYYAAALDQTAATEPDGFLPLARRQRDCFDRAAALFDPPAERLAIPYEGTTLPACFFPAPGASPGEPRPLVIVDPGEAPRSLSLVLGGAAAAERGYHWLTFDGPGQGAALQEQHLYSRPDREVVVTAIVDAVAARPDVDARRMAIIGVGRSGYDVLRAVAFEHRLAAAVADPGVAELVQTWIDSLPAPTREVWEQGDAVAFDREMRLTALFSPGTAALLRLRGAAYGEYGGSSFRLFQRIAEHHLGDEIDGITTPVLLTEHAGSPRWRGQAAALATRIPGAELLPLAREESPSRHGGPLAPLARDARIFAWLDRRLAPAAG